MAIQQHPIPQDISNYKFRLIGDMTIKQFASLGISIVVSVMVYSSPLPFFFKYPISFIFLVLGVGMAFVPVQGRTLDVWIVAFIKSIYSPTQYIWKHGQDSANTNITTAPQNTPTNNIVEIPNTPVVEVAPPATEGTIDAQNTITPPSNIATDNPVDTLPTPEAQPSTVQSTQPPEESVSVSNVSTPQTQQSNIATDNPVDTLPNPADSLPTAKLADLADPAASLPTPAPNPQTVPSPEAQNLPVPFTPSTPNTLVGLTLTPDGKTLDGVMVEIKQQSLTLRATKSNKLGQFLFARPLENGLYQILAEKDGYKFSIYSLELQGEIMYPLKIQAQ